MEGDMADDAQGFSIALDAPFSGLFVLTGVLPDQTGFGSDDLETFRAQYNLSELQRVLPRKLSPDKTTVNAAVGLSSINNCDDFNEWTFAVDEVTHEIKDGNLLLNIVIAGQGGQPDAVPIGGTPGLVFVGDVIKNLAYHVTVLTKP